MAATGDDDDSRAFWPYWRRKAVAELWVESALTAGASPVQVSASATASAGSATAEEAPATPLTATLGQVTALAPDYAVQLAGSDGYLGTGYVSAVVEESPRVGTITTDPLSSAVGDAEAWAAVEAASSASLASLGDTYQAGSSAATFSAPDFASSLLGEVSALSSGLASMSFDPLGAVLDDASSSGGSAAPAGSHAGESLLGEVSAAASALAATLAAESLSIPMAELVIGGSAAGSAGPLEPLGAHGGTLAPSGSSGAGMTGAGAELRGGDLAAEGLHSEEEDIRALIESGLL